VETDPAPRRQYSGTCFGSCLAIRQSLKSGRVPARRPATFSAEGQPFTMFAAMTRASGRVPQISVVVGPAAGAAAYGPADSEADALLPRAQAGHVLHPSGQL
jgi:hypothetical protein